MNLTKGNKYVCNVNSKTEQGLCFMEKYVA